MDPQQLLSVESLCNDLYGHNNDKRQEAQIQLHSLQSNPDFIPQCQYILDNSLQTYAQHTALISLEILISQYWKNFSPEQKVEIRNYILSYLAIHANDANEIVINDAIKLSCRITKLGWFDCAEHREIIEETNKFLDASINHHVIGLKLLNDLVIEMNAPSSKTSLTQHRKTAISYRDHCLFQSFQTSISSLKSLKSGQLRAVTPDEQNKISKIALLLAVECLSFDFIGTNPEESAEDIGTVQAPSSWRPVVADTSIMTLFFEIYATTSPPQSALTLKALVQLSSIRRSLFPSDLERTVFLECLMGGIKHILQTSIGLQHDENYHEFCRLLGRLKASYQLSELVKITGFSEWLDLAGAFSMKSLENWQTSMNSIHNILAMWGRLVAALPYLRSDSKDSELQAQKLKHCSLTIAIKYMQTMIDSVDICVQSQGAIDDPLNDQGAFLEQMERLPVIARLQFETVAEVIVLQFEKCLQSYEQGIQIQLSPQIQSHLTIIEGHMTWLVYFAATLVGVQSQADARSKKSTDILWDGKLCKCVFMLIHYLENRLTQTNGTGLCDEKLEVSLLFFLRAFKKNFVLDNNGPVGMATEYGLSLSISHPLLSLDSTNKIEEGKKDIDNIYDAMGIGDNSYVMNMVINKICSNIKYWYSNDTILGESLDVFIELVSSYNSSKTLLNLDTIKFLVSNHTGTYFPFLGYDTSNKYRINFYSALSRLVFSSSEDLDNQFDVFMIPNLQIIEQLSQTENLRSESVRIACIGILRDLRGIVSSTYNKRTYNIFFDSIYPLAFPLFTRIAETWYDDPTTMTALFKFFEQLVFNKGQRINFEQSSPNGILLFRECSNVVCAYGSRILQVPVQNDIYLEKYKGIRLMLNTLTCSLSGNYVNFGVFGLYNDTSLQNSFDVCLQLCLQVPLTDVLEYIKLSKAYFGFLEILFRNHLDVLSGLDSSIFIQLVQANLSGLQSNDLVVSAICASSVDHIATYIFLNMNKTKSTVHNVRVHLSADPELLFTLTSQLFNTLLFTSHANQWAISRPILSLLLASESSFNQYQEELISTQASIENKEKIRQEFVKLTENVARSLETSNRDKFTQKLSIFRTVIREFIAL